MVQTVSQLSALAAAQVSRAALAEAPGTAASALHMCPDAPGLAPAASLECAKARPADAIVDGHVRGKAQMPMQQHAPLHRQPAAAGPGDRPGRRAAR